MGNRPWTRQEDWWLKAHYSSVGLARAVQILKRTHHSIKQRVQLLGCGKIMFSMDDVTGREDEQAVQAVLAWQRDFARWDRRGDKDEGDDDDD